VRGLARAIDGGAFSRTIDKNCFDCVMGPRLV
jgi:hypothetical protein